MYEPNTVYTLSGDNIITSQLTSPATGDWEVNTGTSDPDNVMLNKGTSIINCPYDYEKDKELAGKFYRVFPFYYKGWARGHVTMTFYLSTMIDAAMTQKDQIIWPGGMKIYKDGIQLLWEQKGETLVVWTRENFEEKELNVKIDLTFER
jgi:hypothetical protein